MEAGIVVFPGSNCDHDCYLAVKETDGIEPRFIWHRETDLSGLSAIILPGGFSYGDYLRAGAIARFSPVMKEVVEFAKKGGPVLGICNGFQILTEVGLLPGTLRMNTSLRFICREINLLPVNTNTLVSKGLKQDKTISVPIAHKMGNYFADPETLKILEDTGRVVFKYCDETGGICEEANPNGSLNNIAGICDETGRIVGMMPHPERRMNKYQPGSDGSSLFTSLSQFLQNI
ncbi:MAG: phosphoribosylformylglycinamidine synthase subunit PurQ [FCB group bacterium]|nr:phosphoribosylformylglycinamidine synthase subunit PurQ [FCB group bacterium]